ncbi:alternate F1F0 ATPase, F1 subunit alpha [Synechococcus sp. PCC 7336]|uniref:alternate F1F0 ATPase, F1 subunit alpha n=1 Tax=Synechococcus sp. PCC 7336 TaxID=195250 RepID=UPI00034A45FF|nr:alternate F1F0 ATPase, F1 subunit alpha [Synechococcus sp. PCC 7336]
MNGDCQKPLQATLEETFELMGRSLESYRPVLESREVGSVRSVGEGIATVAGLPNVRADELVRFAGNVYGIAYNFDPDSLGTILLGPSEALAVGDKVQRTGRILDVPVGEALLGRVVDALGRPLDTSGSVQAEGRRPVERQAPPFMDRAPVEVPLQTGLKVVDALIPIGRGQRELIVGDRQTGKTAVAVDTIINQRDKGVICVYCAIGQRSSSVAEVIGDLRDRGAMDYSIVVVATGEDPPGLQYITPYAATTMAEYFMESGRDVLIVYDDLTRHAWIYRELSLLLRRPPGREAYPGDIFYLHSRLLERATHLKPELGGGSLTALPIAETQAQNIAAYIPTNLISIADGQIYLSPDLFQQGILPAIDVGQSVSRVGGKTQLSAYRAVAGDLRLSYAQFQELEVFARFGTQLDEETHRMLERGRRVREMLKQPQSQPLSAEEQIAVLLAVSGGIFDRIPIPDVDAAARAIRTAVTEQLPHLCDRINAGDPLDDGDRQALLERARKAIANFESDKAGQRWD